jgi:hypothetical protein
VSILLAAAVVVLGYQVYDRPAHAYNTAYEPCWDAAALTALGATSAFAPRDCSAPPGSLAGLGHLIGTWPTIISPGHEIVIFATSHRAGLGDDGVAYVEGESPPWDSCVAHLGGPWWQLAYLRAPSMSCPRGFHYQPGG